MVRCAQALDNADSDGNLGAIGHLQLAGHEGLDLHAEVVAVGNLGRLDLQPHLHGLQVLNRLRVQGGAVKRGRAGTRGRRGASSDHPSGVALLYRARELSSNTWRVGVRMGHCD